MKTWWPRLLIALCFTAASALAWTDSPMFLTDFDQNAERVPRFGLLQLDFSLNVAFDNPFDTETNRIETRILYPSGRAEVVLAYWTEPYDAELVNGRERLASSGSPHWRVRFTPTEVGEYGYELRAVVRGEETSLRIGAFEAEPSDNRGFIRRSDDPRYLQYDDGTSYFAVGQNVCWVGDGGTFEYERYFDKMAANGENWTRLWMIQWNVALEWTGDRYPPLGRYHLGRAWMLDRIFDLAAERGIAIMLCLDSFNALRIRPPYAFYHENPYAVENGGFLEKPEQFFTDERAKALYRRRLDYLIARYGWRTNLFAWEFWNEVDIIERYVSEEVVAWHREMARYIRERDPYDHLITTSYANTVGDPAMWALDEIELTQSHQYNSPDIAASVAEHTRQKVRDFGKPHLFGEFGVDSSGPHPDKDPDGIGLHNGLWASILSEGAGTAMLWWWDNYVEPRNLYYHFGAVSRFVEGIEWHRLGLRPIETEPPETSRLRLFGLRNETLALAWFQNRKHTWRRLYDGETVEATEPITLVWEGFQDGRYTLEWWDTYTGRIVREEEARVDKGRLTLRVPPIEKDVALKARRVGD